MARLRHAELDPTRLLERIGAARPVGRGDADATEPLERAGDRRVDGVRLRTGDRRRSDEGAGHLLGRPPDRGLGSVGPGPQEPLDVGEALGGEQPLEHGTTVFGARPQEPREVALGEHHDLVELLRGHVQVFLEQRIGFGGSGGAGHPRAVDELLDQRLRGVFARAGTPPARQGLAGLTHDPVAPGSERHLEANLRGDRSGGVMRPQATGQTGARNLAEQGERDRVEHGGLSRSGRSVQQEEAGIGEPIEVDRLGFGERAERGERQRVESHQ